MCECVEFYRDQQVVRACFTIGGHELPMIVRGGTIRWVRWGAGDDEYALGPDAPGKILRRPAGGYADLAEVLATLSPWARWEPKPVKLAISRFLVMRRLDGPAEATVPVWIDLEPGQFLQGLYSKTAARVYIVTVPPPPEYANVVSVWPRIVNMMRKPELGSDDE